MANIKTRLRDPELREEALQELKTASIRTAAALAAGHIDDRNKFVRFYAADCLLERGDRRYAACVRPLLADPYDMVRVTAIECLARWGCRRERRRIASLIDDPSRTVRSYAAWALGRLRAKESRTLLLKRLASEREDICKAGILEALYLLTRDIHFVEELVTILDSSRDHRARVFAANSLVGVCDTRTSGLVVKSLRRAIRRERSSGIRERIKQNLKLALV